MKSPTTYRAYQNADGLNILLPETIWQAIQAEVVRFYPNECGGILIGRIDAGTDTAVIEQMIMPAKNTATPVFFKRLAKGINQLLSDLFKKSDGVSRYLGEWHSHPNSIPEPSFIDLSTMRKIAANKNITIKTPLLLIVGYNRECFDEQFFITFNNKLIRYERQ